MTIDDQVASNEAYAAYLNAFAQALAGMTKPEAFGGNALDLAAANALGWADGKKGEGPQPKARVTAILAALLK